MAGPALELDLLGSRFTIHAGSPRWAEFLRELWRDFEAPGGGEGPDARAIRVEERDGRSWLTLPAAELPAFDDPWALADALRYWLVEEAVRAARGVVVVHAAAAVGPAGGALFAGASGAGKTTLALALEGAGWSLGSDDLAPVDEVTGLVVPFPKPVSVRGAEPLPTPPVGEWPPHRGGPLLVPMPALRRERAPFSAGRLFFIGFDPGAPGAVEPMTPAQAVAALVEYVRAVDRASVGVLTRLCRQATAARLRYGSTAEALDLIAGATI